MTSWFFQRALKSEYNVADTSPDQGVDGLRLGDEDAQAGQKLSLDGTTATNDGVDDPFDLHVNIDDAVERLGYGVFQVQILFAAGLCFAADAMEVLLLSFLAVVLRAEWSLTPSQESSIVSTVFAGAMLGTLTLSPLGDAIGRRPVFSITAAIIAIFGITTSFCLNYSQLLAVRFLVGFGVGGLTVPFDTLSEVIPTSHRGQNLLWIEFFWTGGSLLVPLLAWWALEQIGSWRLFVILCSIPCIISTMLGIFLVPESPRWLLEKGRHDKALHILRQAAAKNGLDPFRVFPDGTVLLTGKEGETASNNTVEDSEIVQGGEQGGPSIWSVFSPSWRRLMILLGLVWAGAAFLYYGTIIAVSLVFSDEEDADSIDGPNEEGTYDFDYSAIFITSSAEILGLILVLGTIDSWGRIPTQVLTFFLGGLSCFVLGLVDFYDAQSRTSLVVFAFMARLFMMGGSCVTWVSTSEILPTEIRSTGHGLANAMGRIGGFVSPYIISEENSLRFIGFVLLGVGTTTAFFTSKLSETKGKAMGGLHHDSLDFSTNQVEDKGRHDLHETTEEGRPGSGLL